MDAVTVLLSVICLAGSVGVVLLRNPLHAALSLITTMLGVAGFFAKLDAHFLAVTQITVYAGAVMVLVVFVVMLLNIKDDPKATFVSPGALVAALIGAGAFAYVIGGALLAQFGGAPLVRSFEGSAGGLGEALLGEYAFAFELTSVVILASIVAAVMVAKRRDEVTKPVEHR